MKQLRTAWIECKVKRGMFSNDRCVVLTNADGEELSWFVPREYVMARMGNPDWMKVEVLEDEKGLEWAKIPQDQPVYLSMDELKEAEM